MPKHKNPATKIAGCEELGGRFIIATDEATGLLRPDSMNQNDYNAYRVLRQSAAELDSTHVRPLTLLLADTNSRITNFAPNAKFDPSLRLCNGVGKLYPLFYGISGYDIFAVDYVTELLFT